MRVSQDRHSQCLKKQIGHFNTIVGGIGIIICGTCIILWYTYIDKLAITSPSSMMNLCLLDCILVQITLDFVHLLLPSL